MMKRFAVLLYGVVSYAIAFASLLYFIGFTGNLFVPKGVEGDLGIPFWQAILINVLLIVLFSVQHSVMARPWFKQWWTKFIPNPIERSTFLLFTVMALVPLFYFWQPLGGTVWAIENSFVSGAMMALFALGWVILFISTFLINHFDLFGLRQVWLYFRGEPYTHLKFGTPFFYKWVRHPLYFGFILAFWSTPVMTVSRFALAALFTLYILRAILWEEKDLVAHFGETYRRYAEKVPMILPAFSNKKPIDTAYETVIKRD
jgi:protein-S-isoprenylcysteine O-methyltransferase Ste14